MPVLFYQTDQLSLRIPGRCRNPRLKQFCLETVRSLSSGYFDCPYYHSYTVNNYQNLICGDNTIVTFAF